MQREVFVLYFILSLVFHKNIEKFVRLIFYRILLLPSICKGIFLKNLEIPKLLRELSEKINSRCLSNTRRT